mmetsp:Transcript_9254/g.18620  ORF Transcript_9254/g.18620 Transcript_9254/m.18620 type:complete len:83 (-) Transcript_9254:842-1090(-)
MINFCTLAATAVATTFLAISARTRRNKNISVAFIAWEVRSYSLQGSKIIINRQQKGSHISISTILSGMFIGLRGPSSTRFVH